jgi:hypothetical protein
VISVSSLTKIPVNPTGKMGPRAVRTPEKPTILEIRNANSCLDHDGLFEPQFIESVTEIYHENRANVARVTDSISQWRKKFRRKRIGRFRARFGLDTSKFFEFGCLAF